MVGVFRNLMICALLMGVFVVSGLLLSKPTQAVAGINQQMNFQGRLLNAQGATVPDGYYNIQFKIYQDGDGQTAGDTTGSPAGSLKWTENYLNNGGNGVMVKNGYLSVQLGSINPFGSQIDWNQSDLWLSMNIGGVSTTCSSFASCSPDGEMVPMKRLSSSPYALNSGLLGGKSSADFGQLSANQTWTGINTFKNSFQVQDTSSNPLFGVNTTTGVLQVGSATANTNQSVFVLNNYSNATDPTNGTNGAMYYNTSSNTFRCFKNGAWTDCSGAQGNFVNLQGSTPGTAQTGNLNISGMAILGTGLRTTSIDTATSGATLSIGSANAGTIQIGDGAGGSSTTLLRLDQGSSAPTGSGSALLGSMYYDTTLGAVQCYNASGWGGCADATSLPDNFTIMSPEYNNAVMHGTGVGVMSSDVCSDTLNINNGSSGQPTICGTNETYNFYQWTSPQSTPQTYSIYVTYKLPDTFKQFGSGKTSLIGRTDSSNSAIQYQVYRSSSTGLAACGSAIVVSSGSVSSWQTGVASGTNDPSSCGFSPGDSIMFKINITASANANAYVSNLAFNFSNQ